MITEPILIVDYTVKHPGKALGEFIKSQRDDVAKALFDKVVSDDLQVLLDPKDPFHSDVLNYIENTVFIAVDGTFLSFDYCEGNLFLVPKGYEFDNN